MRPSELTYFFKGVWSWALAGAAAGIVIAVVIIIVLNIKWKIQDRRNGKGRK